MKIEIHLAYDGVFDGEAGVVHLLRDRGTGLTVEVPEDLLPRSVRKTADGHRDATEGDDLPVVLTLEWPSS